MSFGPVHFHNTSRAQISHIYFRSVSKFFPHFIVFEHTSISENKQGRYDDSNVVEIISKE